MAFEVKWLPTQIDIYKHGSTLEFLKGGGVSFRNELLPAGSSVVKWVSNPSYQGGRTFLQLPLLKRGEVYHFSMEGEVEPEASILLKVDCFDRSGQSVSTQVFSGKGGDVNYPWNAFSYSIELISTGFNELFFKNILIEQSLGGGSL